MGKRQAYKIICPIIVAMSLLCGLASLFVTPTPPNAEEMAASVSRHAQRRIDILDSYSDKVLYSRPGEWVELGDLPRDMVIYCYVADTLQSWYNLFTVNNDDISRKSLYPLLTDYSTRLSSPLSSASSRPSLINMGTRWYLLKMRTEGDKKVIEGIVVKDAARENISKGRTGVNRRLHIHRDYDVLPLSSDVGAPVVLDGVPAFKLAAFFYDDSGGVAVPVFLLRWIAILLMTLATVLWIVFNRSFGSLAAATLMLVGLMTVSRLWEGQLTEFSQFFSPTLYAHGGFLDSFATLFIFNLYIFLVVFCVFLCRGSLKAWVQEDEKWSKARLLGTITVLTVIAIAVILFASYALASLIRNSGIPFDLLRRGMINPYTGLAYLSLAFLLVCVLLLTDTVLCLLSDRAGKELSCRGKVGRLVYACLASLLLMVISVYVGTQREEDMVAGWSNRLALDRDLGMEMQLRRMDKEIASDPVIAALCHVENTRHIAIRRLEEMYFAGLMQSCDVFIRVLPGNDMSVSGDIAALISNSSPIGPDSHFFYSYDQMAGSRYTGVFSFYAPHAGMANLLVTISPKYARSSGPVSPNSRMRDSNSLPPFYSYAKYSGERLTSFSGDFAYPTLLKDIPNVDYSRVHSFVSGEFRHFLNRVSDDEVIVISRREGGWMSYFVTYSYLLILMFLIALIFRKQEKKASEDVSNYFSTRMRRLIEVSLLATMLTIVTVSVIFVIRRNDRNMAGNMARKISSVQIMLDGECRLMDSYEEMRSPRFVDALERISSSENTEICIYTPAGKLFLGNTPDMAERRMSISRMDPKAFRNISFDHRRYYIEKKRTNGRRSQYIMYAPLFNNRGEIIAIASAPYMEKDSYFTVDAVIHSSMMISLFIILLVVTVLIASSITTSIFQPMLAISRKMQAASPENMEQIRYDGDDEISALVNSYNKMVVDLQESTRQLASAERDKAWSQMARQVAHEIKNPLTPIKLEIQRLMRLRQKNDPSWTEKFDEAAQVVLEHIDILSQTANEFSTFAKLYTEEPVRFDLDKALRDQILLFSNTDVEITYLGSKEIYITGPRPQLIRVFVNLLSNAVQAVSGQEQARVTVSLRRGVNSGTHDIVFEDNGPGVAPDNQDKLFTPNFTTKSSGTGLGLAICRSIVDKCGGTIAYSKSFTLGGACFTVTLPD